MTTQIAVRLPDDLVEFLDDEVSGGGASSRAELVTKALRREQRRRRAERDARIYAEHGEDPELDGMFAFLKAQPVKLED